MPWWHLSLHLLTGFPLAMAVSGYGSTLHSPPTHNTLQSPVSCAGRRSLLMHLPTPTTRQFALSSVLPVPSRSHAQQPDSTDGLQQEQQQKQQLVFVNSQPDQQQTVTWVPPTTNSSRTASCVSCSWQEVIPGLYSIDAAVLVESLSHASCEHDDFWSHVDMHPWQDDLLLQLQQYHRPASLVAPPAPSEPAPEPSQTQAEDVSTIVHLLQLCSCKRTPATNGVQTQVQQGQPSHARYSPECLGHNQHQNHPAVPPVTEPLQQAAVLLLELLQQAVNVRCRTIETHQGGVTHQTAIGSSSLDSSSTGSENCSKTSAICHMPVNGCLQRDGTDRQHETGGCFEGTVNSCQSSNYQECSRVNDTTACGDTAWASSTTACAHPGISSSSTMNANTALPTSNTAAAADAVAAAAALLPPSPLLILFSGGVDSTLLAALAHRALPGDVPIDLSNICFDNGTSPDRLAAISALEELTTFAPTRHWRLIQVNASLSDVDKHAESLRALLAPAATVMDLNIGAALWLATAAVGTLHMPSVADPDSSTAASAGLPNPAQQYRSAARVVLLGHGADEQCGGYGRHRTKFREAGWQGLGDELALDVKRLWLRNLGRDDRLVADHGREGRHPFLDETLMAAVLELPLHVIVDPHKPIGELCCPACSCA